MIKINVETQTTMTFQKIRGKQKKKRNDKDRLHDNTRHKNLLTVIEKLERLSFYLLIKKKTFFKLSTRKKSIFASIFG